MTGTTVAQAVSDVQVQSVQDAADLLVSQARQAAAIFTQYGQEERANALVMIPVIRFNAALPRKFNAYSNYPFPQALDRYAQVAEALKLDVSTPEKGLQSLTQAVAELKAQLNIPATTAEAGVPRAESAAQIQHMAEVAFDDQCAGSNPCYPLADDLVGLLWEAYREAAN